MALAKTLLLPLGLTASLFVSTAALADDAAVLYTEGLELKAAGKTDEAIARFEKAVAEKPSHSMAWASLGHLYKGKGELEKAIHAYEKATSLVKDNVTFWSNLGMAYYRAGRKEDAVAALIKACKLEPKNPDIQSNLGTIKKQMGKTKEAIRHLERAYKYRKDAIAANNLGIAYRVDKRYEDAVRVLSEAISMSPREAQYHFNLGVVYRRMEEVDKAISEYQDATTIDPSLAKAWYDLGHMQRLNHENEKAIAAFRRYYNLVKGKDPAAAKDAADQIESLGGKPPRK